MQRKALHHPFPSARLGNIIFSSLDIPNWGLCGQTAIVCMQRAMRWDEKKT
jgi:hypothetical protein